MFRFFKGVVDFLSKSGNSSVQTAGGTVHAPVLQPNGLASNLGGWKLLLQQNGETIVLDLSPAATDLNEGEVALYNESTKIKLGADGTINIGSQIVIEPTGAITLGKVQITADGDIITPAIASLNLHLHTSAAAGSPTSPPL